MSSAIPPLVCDTPPPIDDLENDDDFGANNDNSFDHSDDGTQFICYYFSVDFQPFSRIFNTNLNSFRSFFTINTKI